MNDQIVSKDHVRAKACRAFNEGKGRDEHGMNPGAAAIETWQAEWDRQYAAWTQRARQPEAEAA